MRLALTLAVALAAGLLLLRLKVPGGMMVGAVLATAALHLSTDFAQVPYAARFAAQCVAGAFLGCTIDRESLGWILCLWRAAATLLLCFFLLHLCFGFWSGRSAAQIC